MICSYTIFKVNSTAFIYRAFSPELLSLHSSEQKELAKTNPVVFVLMSEEKSLQNCKFTGLHIDLFVNECS